VRGIHARTGREASSGKLAKPAGAKRTPDRRFERLYDISRLLACFESEEKTIPEVLSILAEMLPLETVVLIRQGADGPRTFVYHGKDADPDRIWAAKAHAQSTYADLCSGRLVADNAETESTVSIPLEFHHGSRRPSWRAMTAAGNYILLPLAVGNLPPFGALQCEGAVTLSERDLMLANSITDQLSIALDRHYTLCREVALRQHAEFLEKAHRALISTVSHDLKNPLSTIIMATELLLLRPPNSMVEEDDRTLLGNILSSAEHIDDLLVSFVDMDSIEAGRLFLRRCECPLAPILQQAVDAQRLLASGKSIRIELELPESRPNILCDAARIRQVLDNLIGNAIKFSSESGLITVRAESGDESVCISVCNPGSGISDEEAAKVFERFWQAPGTAHLGSGLGLSIVKTLVEAHGGRVWVENMAGCSTTFFFTIPIARPQSRSLAQT
jgi:signal transduction histidine kinase